MSGFEVGATTTFRATHVMPDHPPPENTPHTHDYRVEAIVRREELDARGMVCDLDVLTRALSGARTRLDGSDLSALTGAAAATVEVLARWIHSEIGPTVREDGGEQLAVRVWEGETMFGGYTGVL